MASALEKALAKSKLEVNDKKSKSKKTDMVTVAATEDIALKVDTFLANTEKIKDLETERDLAAEAIRNFSYEYIIKNHETENLIIEGLDGAVNVNLKDQYTNLNSESRAPLADFLTAKGLKPEDHITEESKVVFNFNELTQAEQNKLMKFLSKEIGAERYEKVVETKVAYKIANLKDTMIKKCNTVEEFQEFRSLSTHYNATVAKRVTK